MFIQRLYLFFVLSLLVKVNFAQNSITGFYHQVEDIYKTTTAFYSGRFFEDIYRYDLGNPYYLAGDFVKGSVIDHGKVYRNVQIRYDIYSQQLQIRISKDGASSVILPPVAFISGFSIDGKEFFRYQTTDDNFIYLNKIQPDSNISGAVSYNKNRIVSYHIPNTTGYKFSDMNREFFLIIDNELKSVSTKRRFINNFSETKQKEINNFINKNSIKIRKLTEADFIDLLTFCNSL